MSPEDLLIVLRNDFRSFLHFAYDLAHPGQPLIDGWHLDVIADALVARPPGSGGRLILNAPPRSLKSFCTSVAWPLFLQARIRDLNITIIAGTQDLAADLAEARERLLRSPRLLGVFPSLRSRRIAGGLRFDSGGRLVQSFVGRSQIGRGSDLIIIDDPLAPSHAEDAGRREAVNCWYAKDVAPRLNSRGSVAVLVMQRLHVADLTGHLLAQQGAWSHLALPAIARIDTLYPLNDGVCRVHHKGQALCPERLSVEELNGKLKEMGGRNFLAQYLQLPTHHLGDHYVRSRWQPMVPLPGFEHLPRPMLGFFKVCLATDVLISYFGMPDPFSTYGFRDQTTEEFNHQLRLSQARMAAEAEQDAARLGL